MSPAVRIMLAAFCAASVSTSVCAQKHDYYMTLGYSSTPVTNIFGGTDIDFNYWPPDTSYVFRAMDFTFNAAAICDEDGKLLFYTNGCTINGANHLPITGGDSLNPGLLHDVFCDDGYRAEQGSTFVPHPGNDNLYYLIHLGLNYYDSIGGVGDKLYYTLIDKSLGNGYGAVIEKNQIILEDTLAFGLITLCRHANGRDWWIVVPEMSTPKNFIFLLTPYGIWGPYEQSIGNIQFDDDGTGNAVFSPDGTKYARFDWYNQLDYYDFDRCSGLFSNPRHLSIIEPADTFPNVGGVAFSSNSRYLYVTKADKVFQFDTWVDDLQSSKQTVAVYDGGVILQAATGFFLPQLGPDGRIYICSSSAVPIMHLIEWPDRPGVLSNVIQRGFPLPTYNAWAMCFFPNFRLGPEDGSACDTLGRDNLPLANFRWDAEDTLHPSAFTFTDLSSYQPENWLWDFGDGNMSTDTCPVHTYTSAGMYKVCLTVSNQYGIDSLCRTIIIGVIDADEPAEDDMVISLFPNPFSGSVYITLKPEQKFIASMYDTCGRLISQRTFDRQSVQWNLPQDLPLGIYFVRIHTFDGKIWLLKAMR
jgi:hypothetical protein